MNVARSLTTILFVIAIVNASKGNAKTPANQKVEAQALKAKVETGGKIVLSRTLSLFGPNAPAYSTEDTAEQRFEKMQILIEKQSEYLQSSNEEISASKKTFETICDKEKMDSVSTWADRFFAEFFLGSDTHSIGTAAYLYTSLKTHVTALTKYTEEIKKYTDEVFKWYRHLFLLNRIQAMVKYIALGLQMSLKDMPPPLGSLNEQTQAFATLISNSAYSPSLLASTSEMFFEALARLPDVKKAYGVFTKEAEEIAKKEPSKKPTLAVTDERNPTYTTNVEKTAKFVCTCVLQITLLALGHSSTSSLRKTDGTSLLKEQVENYKNEFFSSYAKIFYSDTDDFGNYLKNKENQDDVYLKSCTSPSGLAEASFDHHLELISWALVGVKLSLSTYTFRQFFSGDFYLGFDLEDQSQPVFAFDRFVILGPGLDDLNYDSFVVATKTKYLFHYKFIQDYMTVLVMADNKISSVANTKYTQTTFSAFAEKCEKAGGVPTHKDCVDQLDSEIMLTTLDYIYRAYSFIRYNSQADLPAGQDAAAVDVYKVLLAKLTTKDFLALLIENSWIDEDGLLTYWIDMVTYTCYKIDIAGNCGIDVAKVGVIYTSLKVSWELHIKLTYLTILVQFNKKMKDELAMAEFSKALLALGLPGIVASCAAVKNLDKCITVTHYESFIKFSVTWLGTFKNENESKLIVNFMLIFTRYIQQIETTSSVELTRKVILYFWMRVIRYSMSLEGLDPVKDKDKFKFGIFVITKPIIDEWTKYFITSSVKARRPGLESALNRLFLMLSGGAGNTKKVNINLGLESKQHAEFMLYLLWEAYVVPVAQFEKTKLEIAKKVFMLSQAFITKSEADALKIFVKATGDLPLAIGMKETSGKYWLFKIYLNYFLEVAGLLEENDLSSKRFANLISNEYQNPANIMFNFISVAYLAMESFNGPPQFFHLHLWENFNTCMHTANKYSSSRTETTAPEIAKCPYSYRKYAELLYFIKFNFNSLPNNFGAEFFGGKKLLEFHDSSDILVHHRLFMASNFEDTTRVKLINDLCEGDTDLDFCVTWAIVTATYTHCSAKTSQTLTPAEFYASLADIVGFAKTGKINLSNRFNILSASDTLMYFMRGKMMNFDRFLSWFSPKFMNQDTLKLEGNAKLLRDAKPYDLAKVNEGEYVYETAKTTLGNYLRLHYFKNKFEGYEYGISQAIAHAYTNDELLNALLISNNRILFYPAKLIMMFSEDKNQYAKMANYFMGNNYFLKIPKINLPTFDNVIRVIIDYVACHTWKTPFAAVGSSFSGTCADSARKTEVTAAIYYSRLVTIIGIVCREKLIKIAASVEQRFQADPNNQVSTKNNGITTANVAEKITAGFIQQTIITQKEALTTSGQSKVKIQSSQRTESVTKETISVTTDQFVVAMRLPENMTPEDLQTMLSKMQMGNFEVLSANKQTKTTILQEEMKTVKEQTEEIVEKLDEMNANLMGSVNKGGNGGGGRMSRRVLTRVSV